MATQKEHVMRKILILSGALTALAIAPSLAFAQEIVIEPEVETWVTEQPGPIVTYDGDVVVGDVLPEDVEVVEVPKFKKYRYVIIKKKRVLLDGDTRKVIAIY
jgi:Protein of unknown function (DUF1236)